MCAALLNHSYDFLRWCIDMLTAVMQAGVVETHIFFIGVWHTEWCWQQLVLCTDECKDSVMERMTGEVVVAWLN